MRWRRAEMSQKLLDEMLGNVFASAAMKMLDWSGLTYDLPGRPRSGPIDDECRRKALRTTGTIFLPAGDELIVRDAFDALFDGFERLEQSLQIKLIVFEDVNPLLSYYVAKLARSQEFPVIRSFLKEYQFQDALRFLDRFDVWRSFKGVAPGAGTGSSGVQGLDMTTT